MKIPATSSLTRLCGGILAALPFPLAADEPPAAGPLRSGPAEATLLADAASYQAGVPFLAALRLKLDPGWHTYWRQPGEGGMAPSLEWKLPPGWKAGETGFPPPTRFLTGDLANFGYKGEVLLTVQITPPAAAAAAHAGLPAARIALKASWLTCDDSACLPGDASLSLLLPAGEPQDSPEAAAIQAARRAVPQPDPSLRLALETPAEGPLRLTLVRQTKAAASPDPAACAVFPAVSGIVDDASVIRFQPAGENRWTAEAARSPYPDAGARLVLILVPSAGGPAVEITQSSPTPP